MNILNFIFVSKYMFPLCIGFRGKPGKILHAPNLLLYREPRDMKFPINTIPSPIDLIHGFGKATIVLPNRTKFHINDALMLNLTKILFVSKIFVKIYIILKL